MSGIVVCRFDELAPGTADALRRRRARRRRRAHRRRRLRHRRHVQPRRRVAQRGRGVVRRARARVLEARQHVQPASPASRRRCRPRSPCRCTSRPSSTATWSSTSTSTRRRRSTARRRRIMSTLRDPRPAAPPSAASRSCTASTSPCRSGEVHAVMGPNGAGKSTLSAVVMGKPGYEVLGGSVTLDGVDMLALPAWQRAQAGLHLVMQYPTEVPGVSLDDVMARGARRPRPRRPTGSTRCSRPRPRASASRRSCCTARSTSTCPAARRSATRRCSWPCCSRGSPSSTSSTPGLDIDALRDCARRVEDLTNERRPRACWPSRTTTGCSRSCTPT